MDYAVKHMQEKDKDRDEVALLNYMQLCKQMTLPCELVGLMGREETYEHKNELAQSCSKQKVTFNKMLKISKKI